MVPPADSISEFPKADCGVKLAGEEGDTGADQGGGDPAATVYVFMEKDLGGGGVADEGERGAGRGGERDVHDAEGEEQGEEAEGHREDAKQEHFAACDGFDGADKPRLSADVVEVADAPHSACGEHVAGDGGSGNGEDGGPGFDWADGGHRGSLAGWWGCSVSEGPLATKPTPPTMSRMPSQR